MIGEEAEKEVKIINERKDVDDSLLPCLLRQGFK